VLSGHRQRRVEAEAVGKVKTVGLRRGLAREPLEPNIQARRPLLHHLRGFLRQTTDHAGHAPLQDARLLPGDLGEAVAELVGVLVLDARHARDGRGYGVRRVETTSEANLEHHAIDPLPGEEREGGSGGGIEERGPQRRVLPAHGVHVGTDLLDDPR